MPHASVTEAAADTIVLGDVKAFLDLAHVPLPDSAERPKPGRKVC